MYVIGARSVILPTILNAHLTLLCITSQIIRIHRPITDTLIHRPRRAADMAYLDRELGPRQRRS